MNYYNVLYGANHKRESRIRTGSKFILANSPYEAKGLAWDMIREELTAEDWYNHQIVDAVVIVRQTILRGPDGREYEVTLNIREVT